MYCDVLALLTLLLSGQLAGIAGQDGAIFRDQVCYPGRRRRVVAGCPRFRLTAFLRLAAGITVGVPATLLI
jgi:hypothetical protein